MINRDDVAREKMQRAVQMLQENGIDMWVFYTRLKVDTALELMFNTDTQNEVLFLLTRGGDRIAVALPEDAEKYEKSGLYTRVISTEAGEFMKKFKELFDEYQVQSLALNDSMDDTRCDGLSMGL